MKQVFPILSAQFFTATIYQFQPALAEDRHKDVIIESLQFLVREKRIELNAFVIMSNHLHLIFQPLPDFSLSSIQSSFMKYTAKHILLLLKNNPQLYANFKVNKYDRNYQLWKREPLSIELVSEPIFIQKLEYIHYNPVKAGLCKAPENYKYSSAKFYCDGTNNFAMLTHFSGN